MIEIFAAVSADLNDSLAAAGYPRLLPFPSGEPGRILIGEPGQFDKMAPPRVIARPLKVDFKAADMSLGSVRKALDANDPQRRAAITNGAILTDAHVFEIRACSLAPDGFFDPDVVADYDAIDYEYTQALYQQVIISFQRLNPNGFGVEGGLWEPKRHLSRIAREFVFRIELHLPILRELIPTRAAPKGAVAGLPFAPPGTAAEITDTFVRNPAPGQSLSPELPNQAPGQAAIDLGVDPGTLDSEAGCED